MGLLNMIENMIGWPSFDPGVRCETAFIAVDQSKRQKFRLWGLRIWIRERGDTSWLSLHKLSHCRMGGNEDDHYVAMEDPSTGEDQLSRSHSNLEQKEGKSVCFVILYSCNALWLHGKIWIQLHNCFVSCQSMFGATVNLSKSFLGAASFAFPWVINCWNPNLLIFCLKWTS